MKEVLISYKTAKLAKEKGFNERCESGYKYTERVMKNPNQKFAKNSELLNEGCTAPSQGILQKWLREQHNIRVFIENKTSGEFGFIIYTVNPDKTEVIGKPWVRNSFFTLSFKTYEEALEEGLKQGLSLIK